MDTKNQRPKTIATIDVNLQMPKMDKRQWLTEEVDQHFHCVLCGDQLRFRHKTDFVEQVVTEDAHCPSCNVRNRQSTYRLQ